MPAGIRQRTCIEGVVKAAWQNCRVLQLAYGSMGIWAINMWIVGMWENGHMGYDI